MIDNSLAISDQIMHIFEANELTTMEALGLLELIKADIIDSIGVESEE